MWWTGHAVGFDLETDGQDPTDARIITAATAQIASGQEPYAAEVMAKPERPIPEEATNVHHITTERAEAEGAERMVVVRHVVEQLSAAGDRCPVVGHNVGYDLTVLDREMRRTGVGRLELSPVHHLVVMVVGGITAGTFPVIDTYVLDKAVDRYRKGRRTLGVTAEFYGVPMAEGSAHGATADVFASLRIAFKIHARSQMDDGRLSAIYGQRRKPREMAAAFQRLGALTLGELHQRQLSWAAEQAMGLRDHFIQKGDRVAAASVDGRWPFRPLDVDEATEVVNTTII